MARAAVAQLVERRPETESAATMVLEVTGWPEHLVRGLIHVLRQTYPGRGGLVTKETKKRRRRTVPIIDPLRPTLVRLTAGRRGEERLVLGPREGRDHHRHLRDATGWDALVTELGSRAWSATAYGTPR